MVRPVLGIICCTRAVGHDEAQVAMNRYVTAAMAYADCAALLVPSLPMLMEAGEIVPRLDGLLLTGSPSNVSPARYGERDAADADGPFDTARDEMTAAMVQACLAAGKPVFGICRGLQELNVIFGGTLRRDMSRADAPLPHHAPDDASWDAMFAHGHEVTLAPGGVLGRALGKERIEVNSVHFQGVARLADGLRVEATAPDGVVEAFSATGHGAPVLAVQWHPEWHTAENDAAQAYFTLLGRALRGQSIDG
ncbi:gamma-glutamyl-gamma-aminobutyrate hydrolase family protein [Sphingomonas sp. TX0543]|uniref:gamma-glutamyl-gamma-aminobutyrate hydrolase family protein n=1 Tax=unclassified Sphingomonas TaxID=196159 RepID=UPI0010F4A7D0|nr:gamma-glutamyl-gamma-aminobutyrate hydrolase family protein [Sphingomonas sp. 3P27F8]